MLKRLAGGAASAKLEAWFNATFARNVGRDQEWIDYASVDLKMVLEVKERLGSVRDLHAAVMRLAIAATRAMSDTEHVVLVVFDCSISPPRLHEEWAQLLEVVDRKIVGKLAIVIGGPDQAYAVGSLGDHERLVAWAQAQGPAKPTGRVHSRESLPTPKFFDVWKVLFAAWLRCEGDLSVQAVEQRAGAAYPTVADALKRLQQRGELVRGKNRSVRLARWPHTTMTELVPLLPALRRTVWFADQTGRGVDPAWLLTRAQKVAPRHVALGGVEAARALDPSFDLVGLPRLDLTQHVGGDGSLEWVEKIDPALGRTQDEQGAALAIHLLTRAEALFSLRGDDLALADPAEIVLDVTELRLGEQRDALVRALRQGAAL